MGNPKTLKTLDALATQIEALVAGYVDEVRRCTQQAVERGLSMSPSPASKPSANSKRTYSKRRSPAELSELGEALCGLIHERPGESMVTFAAELGVSVRALHRPMTMLQRENRIRSVGQRHLTRYFPAVNGKAPRARG
jgi:hypothetical protein